MDKFSNGEKVYSKTLKKFVFIKEPANYHTPTLYTCEAMPDGEEYAFYENELMSVYEHDKHFGLIPDSLFKGGTMMSNICINVEFLAGTSILDAIREAKRKAIAWDVAFIMFKFNGTSVSVGPKCNTWDAHNEWTENMAKEDYFVFNR